MRGGQYEQDLSDMQARQTADMAARHKALIVGVKTAHYNGPEFAPVERSVEGAGSLNPVWPIINAHVLDQTFRSAASNHRGNQARLKEIL